MIGFLFCLYFLSFNEKRVARILNAEKISTGPLLSRLQKMCDQPGGEWRRKQGVGRPPRLYLFSNPAPLILAVKTSFGQGAIFLSQGLVAATGPEALQMQVQGALKKLLQRGLWRQVTSLLIAFRLTRMGPAHWLDWWFSDWTFFETSTRSKNKGLPFSSALFSVFLIPLIKMYLFYSEAGLETGLTLPRRSKSVLTGVPLDPGLGPLAKLAL